MDICGDWGGVENLFISYTHVISSVKFSDWSYLTSYWLLSLSHV